MQNDENKDMSKTVQSTRNHKFTSKWIALEGEKVIAEGIDLSEVYVNAMMQTKSKPQFKRVSLK